MVDLTGVLQSAAFWVSNRGGTSGRKLYFYFYLMTTALSAVLGNDPVILSGTAFLVYFTKIAEVSHVAWIFSEFVTCNTASMLLFVGTPYP
jgi:Na+/H+ antiporter NhaD/arsenite permease-like protein